MRRSRKTKEGKKQILRLGWGFLIILLGLILTAWMIKNSRHSLWDGHSRLSLIQLGGEKIELISLLPDEHEQLIWQVPTETEVQVPLGYGDYQFGKVFRLGQLEGIGGPLLLRTATNFFGLPVTAYRVNGQTNLSWWDRVRLKLATWSKRNQVVKVDLGGKLNQLDEMVNEAMFDPQLSQEEIKVAVLNAAGVPGEAALVARILTNLGAQVVTVGNSDAKLASSQIWLGKETLKNSHLLEVIDKLLGSSEVSLNSETDQYRADVVVFVGENYVFFNRQ